MAKPPITGDDYVRAAARLGCHPAAIEAVAAVESSGSGFNPDDSCKTLFEGHIFHRFTGGRFDKTHTTLSFPTATREWYGRTWQDEQTRLEIAMALDETAAMLSASWGRFQIMGFNHGACGYATVQDFVAAMRDSEAKQLEAFVGFIESRHLADELRDCRWADFARLYNGPGYKANRYDEKMANAYRTALHARGED
jgi:hypothetical protein